MPSDPPLVSVILPTYNAERFIDETIRSAVNQSYSNLEIVVADDGSGDDTVERVRAWAERDSRIRVFSFEHTGLPGVTRNRAMGEARGDYFAFLDCDDLWAPTKIAEQMKAIEGVSGPVLCYTAAREFADADGPPESLDALPLSQASPGWISEALNGGELAEKILSLESAVCTPSALFNRELLSRAGAFNQSDKLRCAEDSDFFARAASAATAVFVARVMVHIRRNRPRPDAGPTWPSLFAMLQLAEERGQLVGELFKRAWSAAWLVRAEEGLRTGSDGWRRAMFKAWKLRPFNPRRAPALVASALPASAARACYFQARALARG